MKKYLLLTLLLLVFGLVACGNNSDETTTSNKEAKAETALSGNYTIFGGSVGGAWSVFTEGISEAIRKAHPGTMVSAVPGTVAGNPISAAEGKADFAISESLTARFAYEGEFPFDNKHEKIRAVAAIMPVNVFQLAALEKAPFDNVEEIAQDAYPFKYSAGEKDALGDIVSQEIFAAYDLDYEKIEANGGDLNFLSGAKSFELMADKRIEGLGKMVPVPTSDILEAAATLDLKLVPIGDKAIQHLEEKYEMTAYTIPKGTYDFQTEDYETINSPTILITSEDQDDELVYEVTKAIYNQLDYLKNVHNGFKEVNDETIVEVGGVPMHTGAERYYKEIGLMK